MCGITGWFNCDFPEQERSARLEAMCGAIKHRGPDDQGFFLTEHAALGMRRLSIIDIAGGHQPVQSDDGRITLIFNGEIYNHDALRAEMRQRGHNFKTRSDTEVLLRLYETSGLKGFERCNGMFAIAIWDEHRKSLRLVRDRLGVKPLYYYWDGKCLLFGSEIKAIIAAKAFTPEVDLESVWHYLTFRYVPGPKSIWKNIFKLPPGHHLTIMPGHCPEISQWWDIPYKYPSRTAKDNILDEEFTALLDDASNLRMLADVPVGILLSGGLDSSVVAALAQQHSTKPIKTFSVAFDGAAGIDERPFARQVAACLGADHHEITLDAQGFCDFLPDFTYYTDEPLADLASVPLWKVCDLASSRVKVVLSGEGSDEIFAGYNFEVWAQRWSEGAKRKGGARLLDFFSPLPQEDMRNWPIPLSMTNLFGGGRKKELFKEPANFPDSFDAMRSALARLGKHHPLHQALYLYCQGWLVEDLLMKADRMSMAASIELRTPFLDYRIVEWAAGISPDQKAGINPDGSWGNKRILRRLGAKLLPAEIIDRPKMGFPVPAYDWLSGPLSGFASDVLTPGARIAEWLHYGEIERTLKSGLAADADMPARHELWQLIILELWAQKWRA